MTKGTILEADFEKAAKLASTKKRQIVMVLQRMKEWLIYLNIKLIY